MAKIATLTTLVAVLAGVLAGVGVFTFVYGEGHSYLRDDPAACANCHIMQPQFESWQRSSHSAVATCNDCHLPSSFLRPWVAKLDNGLFHAWAFTFRNFHEPIQIRHRNLRVLQERCVECHRGAVHALLPATAAGESIACMSCHHSVGHAARGAGQPRSPRVFDGTEGAR
jgi:cytochrome c nitrite reductase small subunit